MRLLRQFPYLSLHPLSESLSFSLFNLYAEYIMRNARLEEAQTGLKIAGKNINNLRYADDTTLMAENEEELKIKDSDAGRDWGQEEKGTTEDEMAGWHH